MLAVPVGVGLSNYIGKKYRQLAARQQSRLADGNAIAQESLASVSTVRALGAEVAVRSEYSNLLGEYLVVTNARCRWYFFYIVM